MASLVMTVLGPDRPGLVESVSKIVAEHKGNWLESRMAHLAGQFAGVVHVQAPDERLPDLVRSLQALDGQGLTVIVHQEGEPPLAVRPPTVDMHLVGGDRPGIVQQVTHLLAEKDVNVEEFQTECSAAAMSGEPVFVAKAKLQLPANLSLAQLEEALEAIAHDLMVDIRLIEESS